MTKVKINEKMKLSEHLASPSEAALSRKITAGRFSSTVGNRKVPRFTAGDFQHFLIYRLQNWTIL